MPKPYNIVLTNMYNCRYFFICLATEALTLILFARKNEKMLFSKTLKKVTYWGHVFWNINSVSKLSGWPSLKNNMWALPMPGRTFPS